MKKMMEPQHYVNGWRFLQIGVLIHLWMIGESTKSSFILILLLLIMACLRWRFRLSVWTVLVDGLMCLLYFPYTTIGYYGLALPIFELAVKGRALISLLFFIVLYSSTGVSSLIFWYFIQVVFFGMFSHHVLKNQQLLKHEADEQRKARYELEQIKVDLLNATQSASHHAELMERQRIARQLHDHLGHDLTGASLALQAYEVIEDPEQAKALFAEIKQRLERSTTRLRETVHNETPTTLIGVERLDYIVRNFGQVDIQFEKSGDMFKVPLYIWGLLEACLKESLTNVARHSNATEVQVDLKVTDSIVRLLIQDNGTPIKNTATGSGLRSLQMRARSLDGSLSINRENGFLLVCVIPLEDGRGRE